MRGMPLFAQLLLILVQSLSFVKSRFICIFSLKMRRMRRAKPAATKTESGKLFDPNEVIKAHVLPEDITITMVHW
jgi:hypothetical protein